MGGGGQGAASGAPAASQAIGGSNKSSGAQGSAASTATMQDLLKQMQQNQRQQMWNQVGQGFQQAGSIVGKQQPSVQMGGGAQVPGPSTVPAQAQAIYAQGLGQLFPEGLGGAGGINEQQLAMILSRLGYGGGGF